MKSLMFSACLALAAVPAGAVETSMQFVLEFDGNAQRDVTTYQCDGIEEPMTVQYINAHPTFLAIVPIEGEDVLFVNVISASGARYVSGEYEWWSRGNEAMFTNVMDGTEETEAEPTICHAAQDTP